MVQEKIAKRELVIGHKGMDSVAIMSKFWLNDYKITWILSHIIGNIGNISFKGLLKI